MNKALFKSLALTIIVALVFAGLQPVIAIERRAVVPGPNAGAGPARKYTLGENLASFYAAATYRASRVALGLQAPEKTFDITSYGCVGDDSTDNSTNFKKAIQAWNAHGGVLYIPSGTFQLSYGSTADADYFQLTSTLHAIIQVTGNFQTIRMHPKAKLRIKATSYSSVTSGGPSGLTSLKYFLMFGTNSTGDMKTNFRFEGYGGQITWEVSGGQVLAQAVDGSNGFIFMGGYCRYQDWENVTVDGFPCGGGVLGETVTVSGSAKRMVNANFKRFYVTNFGGSGHDNWFYFWGLTRFEDSIIQSSRQFTSHAIYWGSKSLGVVIDHCYFEGIANDPTDSNSYTLHVYNETGAEHIEQFEITNNVIKDCKTPLYFQTVPTTSYIRNFRVNNNDITGSSTSEIAITFFRARDGEIRGNYFNNTGPQIVLINDTVNAFNVEVSNNRSEACGSGYSLYGANLYIHHNVFSGMNNTAGTRIAVVGANNRIEFNELIDAGDSTSGSTAIVTSGSTDYGGGAISGRNQIIGNKIYTFTASRGYNEIISTFSCTRCEVAGNVVVHTQAGYNAFRGGGMNIHNNTLSRLMVVDGTGETLANTVSENRLTDSAQPRIVSGGGALSYVYDNDFPAGAETPVSTQQTGWRNGRSNVLDSTGRVDTLVNTSVSGSLAVFDTGVYGYFKLTATGNITSFGTPTGATDGRQIVVEVLQDGTGGRTITVGSSFSSSCSPTTTAATRTVYSFVYNAAAAKFMEVAACRTGQ